VETEVVLKTQLPLVTVSGTTPTLAAALASLSALLPPMKRAGISPEVLGRLGERVSSLERTGSESSSSLNFFHYYKRKDNLERIGCSNICIVHCTISLPKSKYEYITQISSNALSEFFFGCFGCICCFTH
jgi:hypothetical protein